MGDYLFYVKNTKDLVRYDMKTKGSMLIGTTREAVIALSVTRNEMREWDRNREEEYKGDDEIDEEIRAQDSRFHIACLDEGENVYVFRNAARDRA
jgi:hypothetical protein